MQPEIFSSASKHNYSFNPAATSSIKKKSRVSLKSNTKNRESRRVTIRRKMADISYCQYAGKTIKERTRAVEEESIDQDLLQELTQLNQKQVQQIASTDDIIQNNILALQDLLAAIAQKKQAMRKAWKENRQATNNYHILADQKRIQYLAMKTTKDSKHMQMKKKIYQTVDQHDKIDYYLIQSQQVIKRHKMQIEDKIKNVQRMSQKLIQEQNKHQKMLEVQAQAIQEHKEWKSKEKIEEIHLFTIKVQMSPNLWVGLNILKAGINHDKALLKDYSHWDKSKQRKVTYQDLQRFVLIQLYRGWRSILRKISYQSSQYQVLFGELQSPQIVENLKQNMMADPPRVSQKKQSKAIVFFSEYGSHNRKQELRKLFENFNNGLIHINEVQFSEEEDGCHMNLKYLLPGEEKAMQSYLIEEKKTINKQEVSKWLKLADWRLFCWVDFPVLLQRQDFSRYEEVYELIKRKCIWK